MSNGIRSAALAAVISTLLAAPASAQDSYADPQGSGVLVSAVNWLSGTLLGTSPPRSR